MATWMVHLRIADKLMDELCNLSNPEFVVGNIAPDSGVPNNDWSAFTPSGDTSHFKTTDADGFKDIHLDEYVERYFTVEQRENYNCKQKSFYLGYLTHLLADLLWSNHIARPSKDKYKYLYENNKDEWMSKLKKDWYDLDFLFIKKHPDFRAFKIYKNAEGFYNEYIDFFNTDAFDNRREYITGFYSKKRDDLDRDYEYLKEDEMDQFVIDSTKTIGKILKEEYLK